jgi:steroid delta-isomerase-like uncharacterized protein
VDNSWLDRYVDAWVVHADAGAENGADLLQTLLDRVSPDVRYEDVPTAAVFTGHEGIGNMCRAAHEWSSDLAISVLTRQTDGRWFALETTVTGTHDSSLGGLTATGRTFSLRGVSVGTATDEGLVSQHRDYWDLGSFLIQVGALGLPG